MLQSLVQNNPFWLEFALAHVPSIDHKWRRLQYLGMAHPIPVLAGAAGHLDIRAHGHGRVAGVQENESRETPVEITAARNLSGQGQPAPPGNRLVRHLWRDDLRLLHRGAVPHVLHDPEPQGRSPASQHHADAGVDDSTADVFAGGLAV